MRKTANYDLCQWDAEDRILREDFNRDNEKIDAAIADANPLQDLGTVVLEQNGSELNLDLSGVDWSRYWEVRVYFELTGTENGGTSVLLNHMTSGYDNELGNSANWLARFSLYPETIQGCIRLYRCGTMVGAVTEVAERGSVSIQAYFSGGELQSLDFVSDKMMKAGCRAWICGMKK